jgi:nucleoside-diphosphate-sugar epimerase
VKALVTGATGFIGSHLVDHLAGRNYSIRCLVRKTSDTRWIRNVPVEYVYGDLFTPEALRDAVADVDYVYHSAGITKAKTSDEYYRGNTTGTRNVLEAAAAHATRLKRFVHISSQAAAGPSPTRTPITEEASPHPITAYGQSKWKSEEECHSMAGRVPFTIVRPPAVYGPREKDIFTFFSTMNRGLQPMIGLKDKYVSLIHVSDLVRGFILAAESDIALNQTYFISSREIYSWKELGDVTRAILGKRALRVRIPEPVVYVVSAFAEFFALFNSRPAILNIEKGRDIVQDYWTCDSSKAKRDFGFEEEISLEAGMRETVEWYRAEGWLR